MLFGDTKYGIQRLFHLIIQYANMFFSKLSTLYNFFPLFIFYFLYIPIKSFAPFASLDNI